MLKNSSRIVAAATVTFAAALVATSCSSNASVDRQAGADDNSVESQGWVVGMGDSYMSGEGALVSNKNYTNAPSNWSFWVTGDVNQVFGDNQGQESIPYCHRSYSAPMHFGQNVKSINLACSGAKSGTFTDGNKYKPGIDFDPGAGGKQKGQAALLEEFARSNDVDTIVLSIGGNDFGFADIIQQATKAYVFPTSWEPWRKNEVGEVAVRPENLAKVSQGVSQALLNIQTAMKNAGQEPGTYSIVYQIPPMVVGTASENAYAGSGTYDRQNLGGCGVNDATLDWMNGKSMVTGNILTGGEITVPGAATSLRTAMKTGVANAAGQMGGTKIVVVDNTDTFDGHQLCGKTDGPVGNYASSIGMQPGLPGSLSTPTQPPWQPDNGQKNVWAAPLELFGAQVAGFDWLLTDPTLLQAVKGDKEHLLALPYHPNFWGQRALASCNSQAAQVAGSTSSQVTQVACVNPNQGNTQLDSQGRPSMTLTNIGPLSVS